MLVSTPFARIILYTSTILWVLSLPFALFLALITLFSFAFPGSETLPVHWLIRVVFLFIPLGFIHMIRSSWNYYETGGRDCIKLCLSCFFPLLLASPFILDTVYLNWPTNDFTVNEPTHLEKARLHSPKIAHPSAARKRNKAKTRIVR